MKISRRTSIAMLMLIVAGSQLVACAPAGRNPSEGVEQAYNSSGMVQLKPYTRTIFSSMDF